MNNPRVSVIIPTFKRSDEMLLRAVASVQNQTYQNLEIIIVDDNARSDLTNYRQNVVHLFNTVFSSDNRIKLILNDENLGGALSRNEGIKKSTGEYVTFLDDDDYFLSKKVEHQINFMINNQFNVTFTDLYMYNENEKVVDKRERSDIKSFQKEYLLKYHIVKNITGTETFMVSKQLITDIGMFDNVLTGHEFYLMLKIILSEKSNIGYFKSNDIMAFRTSGECISNGPNKIQGEKDIYKKRKEFFYMLTKKEKRYVRSRHFSVLGISYLRRKKYAIGTGYLIIATLISPVLAFKQMFLKQR